MRHETAALTLSWAMIADKLVMAASMRTTVAARLAMWTARLATVANTFMLVAASLAMLAVGCGSGQEARSFPIVRGDYFGASPPGDLPVMFAPGIASTDLHDDWHPVFSPDGNEAILRVVGPAEGDRVVGVLLHSVRVGGVWSAPAPLWFSNEVLDVEGFVALSADGSRLFVSTVRPEQVAGEAAGAALDRDIWIFERKDGAWGEPRNAGPSVNSDLHDLVTSVGADGTLYFDREPVSGEWFSTTYYARPDGSGGYLDPVELKLPGDLRFTKVAVAPDDSYLVITGFHPGRNLDLYVSFRTQDGEWGEPINLESTNSDRSDKFPGVSPDGRYLFFASRRTPAAQTPPRWWDALTLGPAPRGNQVDIYWVSTQVIERLRPRDGVM